MAGKGLSPEQWERLKQSIKNSVKIETPDFNPDEIPTPQYSPVGIPPQPDESVETQQPGRNQARVPEPEIPNPPIPEEAPIYEEAVTSTANRSPGERKDKSSLSPKIRECYAELENITDQLRELKKQQEKDQERREKHCAYMKAYRLRQKARLEDLKNGGIRTSEDLIQYLRLQAAKERAMKSSRDYKRKCRWDQYLTQRAHLNQHFVDLSELQNITEDIEGDQTISDMLDPLEIEEDHNR